jgi:hypothetical protein
MHAHQCQHMHSLRIYRVCADIPEVVKVACMLGIRDGSHNWTQTLGRVLLPVSALAWDPSTESLATIPAAYMTPALV